MSDPLALVLGSLRIAGGVFLDAVFTAPWCFAARMSPEHCAVLIGRPARVIAFHVVVEGRMHVELEGEPPLAVAAGEIVLLPHNDVHLLASAPGLAPHAPPQIPPVTENVPRIRMGGGGTETRVVCGYMASEAKAHPLFGLLPRLLHVDVRQAAARAFIESSAAFAAIELAEGRPVTSAVTARLSEALLAAALRAHAEEVAAGAVEGASGRSVAAAVADPPVARALALIHGTAAADLTVEGLAREVGLSRSQFIARFTRRIGLAPVRYITACRLAEAATRLTESRASVAEIAFAAGYGSETAFARAFRRAYGVAPGRFRSGEAPRRGRVSSPRTSAP